MSAAGGDSKSAVPATDSASMANRVVRPAPADARLLIARLLCAYQSLVSFADPKATSDKAPNCPLCESVETSVYQARLHDKRYWECKTCRLAFMEPKYRLDAAKEKARYDFHENSPNDAGYVSFLNRLLEPFCGHLNAASAQGLDYGCGPGPTISVLLAKRGFTKPVTNYDPFYFPDTGALSQKYDFVTCTETAEHFFDAKKEFTTINSLLRTDTETFIGLMTEPLLPTTKFATWHYVRDPTHVVFYRPETFQYLCDRFGWKLVFTKKNVQIFSRPPATATAPVSTTATATTTTTAVGTASTTAVVDQKEQSAANTNAATAAASSPATAAASATASGGSVKQKHNSSDPSAATQSENTKKVKT